MSSFKSSVLSSIVVLIALARFASGCAGDGGSDRDAGEDANTNNSNDASMDAGDASTDAGDAAMDAADGSDGGSACAAAPDGLRCAGCASDGGSPTCLCLAHVCVVSTCGDGVVAANEDCDDGNTDEDDGCSATCHAGCGNGVVFPGVEQCDDQNANDGDSCTNACLLNPVGACGNGSVDSGEQCDDGVARVPTDSCTNACMNAICGDGIVLSGTETCDDGNTVNGDGCSSTCSFETCHACTIGNCSRFQQFGDVNLVAQCYLQTGNAQGGPGEGTSKSVLCSDLVQCMIGSGCADGNGLTTDCLCGTGVDPTPSSCNAQAGPCAVEARRAGESTDTTVLLERFTSPLYAIGAASRLVQCEQVTCSSSCGL